MEIWRLIHFQKLGRLIAKYDIFRTNFTEAGRISRSKSYSKRKIGFQFNDLREMKESQKKR